MLYPCILCILLYPCIPCIPCMPCIPLYLLVTHCIPCIPCIPLYPLVSPAPHCIPLYPTVSPCNPRILCYPLYPPVSIFSRDRHINLFNFPSKSSEKNFAFTAAGKSIGSLNHIFLEVENICNIFISKQTLKIHCKPW